MKNIDSTLTKYTLVGIICTFFSMVSYPMVLFFFKNEILTYVVATILNLITSYMLQSVISFSRKPDIISFGKYVYISIGIIIFGNLIYFTFFYFFKDGLVSYYISWIFTSIISYMGHIKYTFKS